MKTYETIDQYMAQFPVNIQQLLTQIRHAIREAAPKATEVISYGMPAVKGRRVLVYYAAFADHLSFFPTAEGVEHFKDELKEYKTSKGTIQIPLDKPLPLDLIKRITVFRAESDATRK